MSIFRGAPIGCDECLAVWQADIVESANPVRHPAFQAAVLERTFMRFPCPSCGHLQTAPGRLLWSDLPGRLCACVLPARLRGSYRDGEALALEALAPVLREEGPPCVRSFGQTVRVRVVYGLEELREKVLCRVHGLDDVLVELLKLPLFALGAGEIHLDEVLEGAALRYRAGGALVMLPGAAYAAALARREELGRRHEGLFQATWVNALRAAGPEGA